MAAATSSTSPLQAAMSRSRSRAPLASSAAARARPSSRPAASAAPRQESRSASAPCRMRRALACASSRMARARTRASNTSPAIRRAPSPGRPSTGPALVLSVHAAHLRAREAARPPVVPEASASERPTPRGGVGLRAAESRPELGGFLWRGRSRRSRPTRRSRDTGGGTAWSSVRPGGRAHATRPSACRSPRGSSASPAAAGCG